MKTTAYKSVQLYVSEQDGVEEEMGVLLSKVSLTEGGTPNHFEEVVEVLLSATTLGIALVKRYDMLAYLIYA